MKPLANLRFRSTVAPVIALLVVGSLGCAPSDPRAEVVVERPAPAPADAAVRSAVDSPERSEADRADDAARKPGDVLAFFGIEPGMTVLDLLAGSGYYTEILSRAVGPEGSVICHNNQAYIDYVGEQLDARLAGDRLANVERLVADVNELELSPGSLDAAIFVLGYHDIYYSPDDGSWPPIDRERLLSELFAALRPGGVLGIVDHVAATGSDPVDTGNRFHRVDPALVREQVESAGFELDGESDVLANAADDHESLVFDEAIRRKTDRFVYRFRKPVEI